MRISSPGSQAPALGSSALLGSRAISTSCASPGSRSHSMPSTALPVATRQRERIFCARCNRALTRCAGRDGSPSSWWVMLQFAGPSAGLCSSSGKGRRATTATPDPLAASFLFSVGDVGAAAPPAGDLQGLDPRPGRVDSRRDGCVRRGRDLVRWARAGFGAVIDLVVSQVCKERCRRWGQKRACRAHLSEVARAMRADRTGTFSPSSPRPRPPRARAPMGVKERADMGGGGR